MLTTAIVEMELIRKIDENERCSKVHTWTHHCEAILKHVYTIKLAPLFMITENIRPRQQNESLTVTDVFNRRERSQITQKRIMGGRHSETAMTKKSQHSDTGREKRVCCGG